MKLLRSLQDEKQIHFKIAVDGLYNNHMVNCLCNQDYIFLQYMGLNYLLSCMVNIIIN